MNNTGLITTSTSQDESRLKVGVGYSPKKKKVLKETIKSSFNGKGGPGSTIPAGYGNPPMFNISSVVMTNKPHSIKKSGISMVGIKKVSSLPSASKSMNKKYKFSSVVKATKLSKPKSLKSVIKGLI